MKMSFTFFVKWTALVITTVENCKELSFEPQLSVVSFWDCDLKQLKVMVVKIQ